MRLACLAHHRPQAATPQDAAGTTKIGIIETESIGGVPNGQNTYELYIPIPIPIPLPTACVQHYHYIPHQPDYILIEPTDSAATATDIDPMIATMIDATTAAERMTHPTRSDESDHATDVDHQIVHLATDATAAGRGIEITDLGEKTLETARDAVMTRLNLARNAEKKMTGTA